jgi:site-specific DNA-methyltransferase (adenine-specific)
MSTETIKDKADIYNDDCFEVMKQLSPDSIDGIICDPPYFINFMNKDWDNMSNIKSYKDMVSLVEDSWFPLDFTEVFFYFWAKECLRVAKPGSYLLAFSSPRTVHHLTAGIEKSGWIIRDTIIPWVYKSGMVKGTNISKQIDKHLGVERKTVNKIRLTGNACTPLKEKGGTYGVGIKATSPKVIDVTESNTKEGKLWENYGTNLAPSYEPVVMAVKPWCGTLAKNALKYGVAGINLPGVEINGTDIIKGKVAKNFMMYHHPGCKYRGQKTVNGYYINRFSSGAKPFGGAAGEHYERIKTNDYKIDDYTCHKDCVVEIMRQQLNDEPAKFFHCKKASMKEKNHGLEDFDEKTVDDGRKTSVDNPYNRGKTKRKNTHPTVKPIELMRFLCRLIKQPVGKIILDPFMGSGSCGIAAIQEGQKYIGIEMQKEYYEIAKKRIKRTIEDQKTEQQELF